MKFYYCDPSTSETPCVFTEHTMQPLWERSGGDIARCIRHGALICHEADAESKQALKARWKAQDERERRTGILEES